MPSEYEQNIKFTIAIHDRYQLGCRGNGTYTVKYQFPAIDCSCSSAATNDITAWYADPRANGDFDNHIRYVLENRNLKLAGSPAWKDLSDSSFPSTSRTKAKGICIKIWPLQ
jgi:mannan endo-1,4-beta-mannosidase